MYTWLYYNQSERVICVKYVKSITEIPPHSSGSSRGAWSDVGVKFNDNPGKKSVHFRGSLIWNNLARDIKSSKSLSEFKTKIKNFGNIDCGCVICS